MTPLRTWKPHGSGSCLDRGEPAGTGTAIRAYAYNPDDHRLP